MTVSDRQSTTNSFHKVREIIMSGPMESISRPEKPRGLFILIDGTSNDYSCMTNIRNLQNIFNGHNRVIAEKEGVNDIIVKYFTGLATSDRILEDFRDNVYASGLEGKLLEVYMYLVEMYRPGDKIYLFGFSRGAYIARCLAGFIKRVGILISGVHFDTKKDAQNYFHTYKEWNKRTLSKNNHSLSDLARRRIRIYATGIYEIPYIEFLGLFDTVMGPCHTAAENRYDTFWDREFTRSSLHLIAKDQNSLFRTISVTCEENGGLGRSWDAQQTGHCEVRVPAGDHCDVGGGWENNPAVNEAISNIYLRTLLKFRFCYLLRGLGDKYPPGHGLKAHNVLSLKDMQDYPVKWIAYNIWENLQKVKGVISYPLSMLSLPNQSDPSEVPEGIPHCIYHPTEEDCSSSMQNSQSQSQNSEETNLGSPESGTATQSTPSPQNTSFRGFLIPGRVGAVEYSGSLESSKRIGNSCVFKCSDTVQNNNELQKSVTVGCLLRTKREAALYFVTPKHGHGKDCKCRCISSHNSDICLIEFDRGLNCFNYIDSVFIDYFYYHSVTISGYFSSFCNHEEIQTFIDNSNIPADLPFFFVSASIEKEALPAGTRVGFDPKNNLILLPFTELTEGDSGSLLFIKRPNSDVLEVMGILKGKNLNSGMCQFTPLYELSQTYDLVSKPIREDGNGEFEYCLDQSEFAKLFRCCLNPNPNSFAQLKDYTLKEDTLIYEIELYQYCEDYSTTAHGDPFNSITYLQSKGIEPSVLQSINVIVSNGKIFIQELLTGTINFKNPQEQEFPPFTISCQSIREVITVRKLSVDFLELRRILNRLYSIVAMKISLPTERRATIFICERFESFVKPLEKLLYGSSFIDFDVTNINKLVSPLPDLFYWKFLKGGNYDEPFILGPEMYEDLIRIDKDLDKASAFVPDSSIRKATVEKNSLEKLIDLEKRFMIEEIQKSLFLIRHDPVQLKTYLHLIEKTFGRSGSTLPSIIESILRDIHKVGELKLVHLQSLENYMLNEKDSKAIFIFIDCTEKDVLYKFRKYAEDIKRHEHVKGCFIKYFQSEREMSTIVVSIYLFLSREYQPDDKLYIFGKAKGAYTARRLLGFIKDVGLMVIANHSHPEHAAKWYYESYLKRMEAIETKPEDALFHKVSQIEFVGLVNTTVSLGTVNRPINLFCDRKFIRRSCHFVDKNNVNFFFPSMSFHVLENDGKERSLENRDSSDAHLEFRVQMPDNQLSEKDKDFLFYHCFPYLRDKTTKKI